MRRSRSRAPSPRAPAAARAAARCLDSYELGAVEEGDTQEQGVLEQHQLHLASPEVKRRRAELPVGKLWVELVSPVRHQVISRRLPEGEDVDAREDVALLQDVHALTHQRRLDGRP